MRKLSITGVILAALLAAGCSTVRDTFSSVGDLVPRALERSALFYKIDVQQGNSIEQPMVNRLEPGMSKSQVQFIMGTPMLIDVFHQDRWDYYFSMRKANGDAERKHIALFFADDQLMRTEGDVRPLPREETETLQEAEVYSVPDYTYTKGILTRMLESVGLEKE